MFEGKGQVFNFGIFFLSAGDPSADSNATGDPFRTLFVGRIVSDVYH